MPSKSGETHSIYIVSTCTAPEILKPLRQTTRLLHVQLVFGDGAVAWIDALDRYFPHLAILDVDYTLDWQTQLRRAQLRPHTRYIPVIALSVGDIEALDEARSLGASEVWEYCFFKDRAASIVKRFIDPPTRYPEGWDQPLPAEAVAGLEFFNLGDYFEQHELLEAAWRSEMRPIRQLYQGILQIGVAFHQIELNNWDGAVKTFRRGLPKLRSLPAVCQGIDLAHFREAAEQIHSEVAKLGPEQLAEFDRTRFPKIKFRTRQAGQ